jgi:hypothetical protein
MHPYVWPGAPPGHDWAILIKFKKPLLRQILSRYPGLVHNVPWRLGVTTNVAWYFYMKHEVCAEILNNLSWPGTE